MLMATPTRPSIAVLAIPEANDVPWARDSQKEREMLRIACDLARISPYTWDPQTNHLEWDERLKAMWGLPPDAEIDYDTWRGAIHPDDVQGVDAAVADCANPEGDGVYDLEYRVIGITDGIQRWISTYGQTFFEGERAVAFVGAAQDITDRKSAEQALRDSERRFRMFAESSFDVLWIMNADTAALEYTSPAMERVWGISPEATLPHLKGWLEATHVEDRDVAQAMFDRSRNQGHTVSWDYRIVRPDGAVRRVHNVAFPIHDEDGRVRRIGGIAHDVTHESGLLIYLVDAEPNARRQTTELLETSGFTVKTFATGQAFLEVANVLEPGCVVLHVRSPGAGGLVVCRQLQKDQLALPTIVLDDHGGDVERAVQVMKAGAADVLQTPYRSDALISALTAGFGALRSSTQEHKAAGQAKLRLAELSVREREVLEGLIAGGTNKIIARELGLSPRTVESHRGRLMERLGARTLPDLVLIAAAAGVKPPGRPIDEACPT
ncbi:MAG TPA: PAS domain-containing protein [Candidatus Dormibacteraeota bacterium]